jgi:hypothetical protein
LAISPAIQEVEMERIKAQSQSRQKVSGSHLNKTSGAWWFRPAIPPIAVLGPQKMRSYLKNNYKVKGLRV